MDNKFWFVISYKCIDGEKDNHLVQASNALEAWTIFITTWQKEYASDDIGYINPQELEQFEVSKLCAAENVIY